MWQLVGAVVLGTLIEHLVEAAIEWCRAQFRTKVQSREENHGHSCCCVSRARCASR